MTFFTLSRENNKSQSQNKQGRLFKGEEVKMFDFDLNNVEEVSLIPAGAIVKAHLNLKPGDTENEPYLKTSKSGGKYLDCEFTVIEGQYMKRKIFHKLGVEEDKIWLKTSRRLIKNLIESANGIARNDKSPEAEAKKEK